MLERKSVDIQINKNYKISSDINQWILQELTVNKKKEKVWTSKYYYTTLSNLLQDVLDITQKGSGATTIKELFDITEKARLELKDLVKPLENSKVLF